MSDKSKENTEKSQDVVDKTDATHKIDVVEIRKECIKLCHSAAKPLAEILADAEIYTTWVLTGQKPKAK